jgi:hypothetical protein
MGYDGTVDKTWIKSNWCAIMGPFWHTRCCGITTAYNIKYNNVVVKNSKILEEHLLIK